MLVEHHGAFINLAATVSSHCYHSSNHRTCSTSFKAVHVDTVFHVSQIEIRFKLRHTQQNQ